MNIDQSLSHARPFVQFIGSIIITVALIKYCGVLKEVPGEFWQIAILGLAVRSW